MTSVTFLIAGIDGQIKVICDCLISDNYFTVIAVASPSLYFGYQPVIAIMEIWKVFN